MGEVKKSLNEAQESREEDEEELKKEKEAVKAEFSEWVDAQWYRLVRWNCRI